MSDGKFVLRWDQLEENRSSSLRQLWDTGDFLDVTLVCDDDQIDAHKLVLSASSPFFQNIFKRNPHSHPLVYLRGTTKKYLQSLLEFIYSGETFVLQEELEDFIYLANTLNVKGLMTEDDQASLHQHSKEIQDTTDTVKKMKRKSNDQKLDLVEDRQVENKIKYKAKHASKYPFLEISEEIGTNETETLADVNVYDEGKFSLVDETINSLTPWETNESFISSKEGSTSRNISMTVEDLSSFILNHRNDSFTLKKAELVEKSEYFRGQKVKPWTGTEDQLEKSESLPEGWGVRTFERKGGSKYYEYVTPDRMVILRSMAAVQEYIRCTS